MFICVRSSFFLGTNAIISVCLPSMVRCFLLCHMILVCILMGTQGGSEISVQLKGALWVATPITELAAGTRCTQHGCEAP